jgi:hypothetical protein
MEHSKENSKVLVQSNFSPHDVGITGPEAVVAEKKGTEEDQWHMWRMGKLQEMRVWRAQNKGPQITSTELILCAAKLSFCLNFRLFHDSHGHVGDCVRVRNTQYLLLGTSVADHEQRLHDRSRQWGYCGLHLGLLVFLVGISCCEYING